jgi:hypothetical protein
VKLPAELLPHKIRNASNMIDKPQRNSIRKEIKRLVVLEEFRRRKISRFYAIFGGHKLSWFVM